MREREKENKREERREEREGEQGREREKAMWVRRRERVKRKREGDHTIVALSLLVMSYCDALHVCC